MGMGMEMEIYIKSIEIEERKVDLNTGTTDRNVRFDPLWNWEKRTN